MDDIKFVPINSYEHSPWEDKIKARSPQCFNIKAELRVCGPINEIRCARCGFTIKEGSFPASGNGYVNDLINEWNRVRDYTHRD